MEKIKLKILIVEDDELSRLTLKTRLSQFGEIFEASNKIFAAQLLKTKKFDLALFDLDLENELDGLELLKISNEKNIYSVVLSGREDDETIEKSYLLNCQDYLAKPFKFEAVEQVIKKYRLKNNTTNSVEKLKELFITSDDAFLLRLNTISNSLLSDRPILITGESGTGKTFLAKHIHNLIDEKKPFIHLNCSEISESLLESELFGHVKGSFTGAIKDKKGLLELANNGTLFLDEIATMPMSLQKKLLKAIEEKIFYPVGSETQIHSNFRLISATCENLLDKIQTGEFRQDLYYRIEGFNVCLPSIRERKNDILNLINFFNRKGTRRVVFDSKAKALLEGYHYPGNTREMERIVEILKTKETGIITEEDVKLLISPIEKKREDKYNLNTIKSEGLNKYLERIEAQILREMLKENKDKVRKTLTDLKISNNAFYRIMENIKTLDVGNG